MLRRLTLVLLGVTLLWRGGLAETGWDRTLPLSLGNVSVGQAAAEVSKRLGLPEREIDAELALYPGNLLVRTRRGRVANVTASGTWTLKCGESDLVATGLTRQQLESRLGPPAAIYRRARSPGLEVLAYVNPAGDLGVILDQGQAAGFMLSESDTLDWSLQTAGYQRVPEEAP